MGRWGLKGIAMLLGLCLAVGAAACSGDAPADKSQVVLKVRPEGSPERRLLTQIYAQALRSAGYDVKRAPRAAMGSTISFDDVQAGKLAGYPEYISTMLFYKFGVEIAEIPTSTRVAYSELERRLEKQEFAAFPPAPHSIANAVGFLRERAERHGLETISDLEGTAERMTIAIPSYCHLSVECLWGIELRYGVTFEGAGGEPGATPELSWWRPEPEYRYEVLEDETFDASILYNTDGRLATEGGKFVILKEDKDAFPASNFVWVTSEEAIDEAGPDYEKAIVEAQGGLTLGVMQRLNAKMEAGEAPAEVAGEYLKSIGYKGV